MPNTAKSQDQSHADEKHSHDRIETVRSREERVEDRVPYGVRGVSAALTDATNGRSRHIADEYREATEPRLGEIPCSILEALRID